MLPALFSSGTMFSTSASEIPTASSWCHMAVLKRIYARRFPTIGNRRNGSPLVSPAHRTAAGEGSAACFDRQTWLLHQPLRLLLRRAAPRMRSSLGPARRSWTGSGRGGRRRACVSAHPRTSRAARHETAAERRAPTSRRRSRRTTQLSLRAPRPSIPLGHFPCVASGELVPRWPRSLFGIKHFVKYLMQERSGRAVRVDQVVFHVHDEIDRGHCAGSFAGVSGVSPPEF